MGNRHHPLTRRNMLGAALAAAGLRGIPLWGAGSPRALVCVYVFGGLDANNLIVPLSAYDSYAALRGPLAIPRGELLNVTSGLDQAQYGFHPALAELAALFQQGALAVVGNVGPETPPVLPDPYLSYFPGGYATPAWAAQMANVTEQDRKSLFVDFPSLSRTGKTTSMTLVAPGVSATKELREAVAGAAQSGGDRWGVEFPATGLGQQLRQAAALIRSGASLGMDRQVFLTGIAGYAGAPNQLSADSALFRELSPAMAAFHAAIREIGMSQSVTTYTDTEFSRALRPNRFGIAEPAWGGHQLVMGGSVLGGSVHGVFPLPSAGGPDDPRRIGVLRPTSSKDQYYATLANWFGLPYPDIARNLPGVRRAARPTLGFMVTG